MSDVDEVVTLNVGGVHYTTTRSTLTQFGDSMIGAMFSGRHLCPSLDHEGHAFIDRDGPMFRHVLNFLRSGRLRLPGDFRDHDMLEEEADFYQIVPLIEAVRTARVEAQNEMKSRHKTVSPIVRYQPGAFLEMYQMMNEFEPQVGGYMMLSGSRWVLLALPLAAIAMLEGHPDHDANVYQTHYFDGKNKMQMIYHLQSAGWHLVTSTFAVAYSPVIDKYDHARCYTTHKYVWCMPQAD